MEQSGLQDDLQWLCAAELLQLVEFVAQVFIVPVKKLAHRHHGVNLRGSVVKSHGRFCHLHLGECLCRGESAGHGCHFHIVCLQRLAHQMAEVGIRAHGCHAGHVGIGIVKSIHTLNQAEDVLFGVGRAERCQVEAGEDACLHLGRVVLCDMCLDDVVNGLCDVRIVQLCLIPGQGGIILAWLMQVFLVFFLFVAFAVVMTAIVAVVMFAAAFLVVVFMATLALVFLLMVHNFKVLNCSYVCLCRGWSSFPDSDGKLR